MAMRHKLSAISLLLVIAWGVVFMFARSFTDGANLRLTKRGLQGFVW